MNKSVNILNKVDLLDLVRIHVYVGKPSPNDLLPYKVFVEPIDQNKRVVFDPEALDVLNNRVTEKAQQFENGRDPRVVDYIKEFVGRMISEFGKNGLAILEDIPEANSDPYAEVRKQH